MKNLALAIAFLKLPLQSIVKLNIAHFWPLLPQFLLINNLLCLGIVKLRVLGNIPVLLLGFALSEIMHVKFLLKKQA